VRAKSFEWKRLTVDSAKRDTPFGRFIETLNQSKDRTFSATARPGQSIHFASMNLEIEGLQRRVFFALRVYHPNVVAVVHIGTLLVRDHHARDETEHAQEYITTHRDIGPLEIVIRYMPLRMLRDPAHVFLQRTPGSFAFADFIELAE
jgi:hypothetical protein